MPEIISLGPFLIVTRVVVFIVAVVVAIWLASRLARRFRLDEPLVRGIAEGSVLVGLATARLAYVALYWQAFAPQPWTALYLWQPGYLPVAGLAGGALYVLYRLRTQSAGKRLICLRAITTGFAAGATILAGSLLAMHFWSNDGVLRAGDRVPNFKLSSLANETVSLSDLQGKGVVLNFWATWCPPCLREMPLLEATWKDYRSRDVAVVGLALGETPDVVRPFVDSHGITYPIWTDIGPNVQSAVDSNEIFSWFASAGLPTTVFIRPDGVIDSVHLGELNRALLLERLPEILPK